VLAIHFSEHITIQRRHNCILWSFFLNQKVDGMVFPTFHCWSPYPQCDGLWKWELWKVERKDSMMGFLTSGRQQPVILEHVCSHCTWKAERRGLWVWGQFRLHCEILAQTSKSTSLFFLNFHFKVFTLLACLHFVWATFPPTPFFLVAEPVLPYCSPILLKRKH
jgi:hypothetical protein